MSFLRSKYALHVLLVEHGKRCSRCAKGGLQKASQGACPLLNWDSSLVDFKPENVTGSTAATDASVCDDSNRSPQLERTDPPHLEKVGSAGPTDPPHLEKVGIAGPTDPSHFEKPGSAGRSRRVSTLASLVHCHLQG